jgi:hypothetical protein
VTGFFGNPEGAGPSKLAGEFGPNSPLGVAVNSTGAGAGDVGDIYVADRGNHRVQRFDADGRFVSMWGRDVIKPNPEVDVDLGDVFEVCTHPTDCQAGPLDSVGGASGSLGGEFTIPRGVAVDQATGFVYVGERAGQGERVQAFTGDGEFLWAVGKDVIVDGSPSDPGNVTSTQVCTVAAHCKAAEAGDQGGEFAAGGSEGSNGGGNGVAVSPVVNPVTGAGNVLVTDRGNRRVQEFTSTGEFVRAFGWDTIVDGSPSDPASVATFQICAVAADCKAGAHPDDNGAAPEDGVGQFGNNAPNRVAVDSAGVIYTVEHSSNFRVQRFAPAGAGLVASIVNPNIGGPGPALPLTGANVFNTPMDVAVGPGDGLLVLRAFAAGTGTPPAAVNERRVVELDAAGVLVETHAARAGISAPIYLAVDTASEEIYMASRSWVSGLMTGQGVFVVSEAADPTASMGVGTVGAHSAQLHGLVNPGVPDSAIAIAARYRFEYREVGDPTWIAVSDDRAVGSGFVNVAVAQTVQGLEANTDYEARLVAFRPFSGVADSVTAAQPFTTPPSRPDIDAVFVTGRQATSATLNATINPNGEATAYRFEYGPTAAYGTTVPVPDGAAGDSGVAQTFSEAISGLEPETTYHYRVVATNVNGTNASADRTFTTRATVPEHSDRAFELVSPPDKVGGSGVSNWYSGPGSHGSAGIASPIGDRYVSYSYYGASLADGGFAYGSDATLGQRTATGWVNRPAFNRPGGFGATEFAKLPVMAAASDDLSLTAWGANTQMRIFEGQADLPDLRGTALRDWETGRWEVLAPFAADQQTGPAVFGVVAGGGGHALAAGDLRGVAGPGDPTHPAFSGGPGDWLAGNQNVYIDDVTAGLSDTFPGEGIRSLANVCTGQDSDRTKIPSIDETTGKIAAATCPDAIPGRDARLISRRGGSLAGGGTPPGHISADGSRVFFMSPSSNVDNLAACAGSGATTTCPPQLYVRDVDAGGSVRTRWISQSAVAGQDAGLVGAAIFEGATPDGDKAFFRTASPLTADDPNGGAQVPGGVRAGVANASSVDLYMYDFPDAPGADPGDGTLTRISAGPTGTGDGNAVTGSIGGFTSSLRAFAADGSRVYFTTAAPLTGVPAPANGTITEPGGTAGQTATKNLYVYDAGLPAAERWRFVARLPATSTLGDCAATGALVNEAPLFTSANGIGGGFQLGSSANCVRGTVDGSFVTLFTDGRLTGDDPDSVSGDVYGYDATRQELTRLSAPRGGAVGGSYVCVTEGSGVGTRCHGQPSVASVGTTGKALLQLVSDPATPTERTAFFESASRLVPEDLNDRYDVYQWRDGELSLLSTGAPGADDALYRGNDRTGTNVYISTRDRWTWQDHDAVLDIYAARVGGGIPQTVSPVACDILGDGCPGSGAQPLGTPPGGSNVPGGANVDRERVARRTLAVGRPSRRARRVAARRGVLRIAVRSNRAGRVRAVGRARVGRRVRRVARGAVRVRAGRRAVLRLRLSRVARRRLARGGALRLVVRVGAPGAKARTMSVRLPGVRS